MVEKNLKNLKAKKRRVMNGFNTGTLMYDNHFIPHLFSYLPDISGFTYLS